MDRPRQIHRQQGDIMSFLLFFKSKGSKLKWPVVWSGFVGPRIRASGIL
jgi:hypothetical protein